MRILNLSPGIYAYYEGRDIVLPPTPTWVEDGALSLGIASYAIADGNAALVYDTHVSVDRARAIREHVESLGARNITVVLSHWHLDHIAGNEAFKDCRIIANARTRDHLALHREAIEAGTLHGAPAINPLILPTEVFDEEMTLDVGGRTVTLKTFDIHSNDATVIWLPDTQTLLAGDTLEDTITYVAEPQFLETHVGELDRLFALEPLVILPNHGDPDIIAAGGYSRTLIRATQQYVRSLIRCRSGESLRGTPLSEFVAGPLNAGWINYFEPYEAVHRQNVERIIKAA
ncbi:MAG: MBL fold metallo-hydrolase [Rhizobiales bacterium]|nr:MBL fold metallo-hydrolase [Hyphomicrobiales bacterium]